MIIINCSFYVKYYTGLHGFVEILAKKLATSIQQGNFVLIVKIQQLENSLKLTV